MRYSKPQLLPRVIPSIVTFALAIVSLFVLTTLLTQTTQAQTFTVIHTFTGGLDGGSPMAGLTMDAAGNLYGTTCGIPCQNNQQNAGTVFRLTKGGGGWIFTPLYVFHGGADGAGPEARVVIGPDGTLYGTTIGGGLYGYGTVFSLRPSAVSPNILGSWKETVLYSFTGGADGANPEAELIFNWSTLYGTTLYGGSGNGQHGFGTVFELTPTGSGWIESVLHTFTGGSDGGQPAAGLSVDNAGNLYGTTVYGGSGEGCAFGSSCGVVFELTHSDWAETVVHNFQGGNDGGNPIGGVVAGGLGAFFGTTSWGGLLGGGTLFGINTPDLPPFPLPQNGDYFPGPWDSLTLVQPGFPDLYGTTYTDGAHGYGSVFSIEAGFACGWIWLDYAPLYDFAGGSDGANPLGNVILDANGNIFGTTSAGGAYGYGVVFEITTTAGSKIAPVHPSECAAGQ